MADVDYDDYDNGLSDVWADGGRMATRASRVMHLAGAACSVCLVLGLGYWGYKLAVRDVTGVPVVRAMAGPMRIAPENPGGEVADHQGLAVNAVAALGAAAPPPDRLILAPRAVDLDPEDLAGLSSAPPPDTAPQALTPTLAAAVIAPRDPAAVAADPSLGPDPDAVAQALAEALAVPLDDLAATEVAADGGSAPIRPRPRPSNALPGTTDLAPLPVSASSPGIAATEIDPSTIPAGTNLVQLGAFDTADQAREEWARLAGLFGPQLQDKSLVVQAAESGGRTFYRLRAHGFSDDAAARGFCVDLLAQQASCIPVEQR
ncbi:MAG: SPOR domain-containing protein [Paracoccaceae bacterium]